MKSKILVVILSIILFLSCKEHGQDEHDEQKHEEEHIYEDHYGHDKD